MRILTEGFEQNLPGHFSFRDGFGYSSGRLGGRSYRGRVKAELDELSQQSPINEFFLRFWYSPDRDDLRTRLRINNSGGQKVAEFAWGYNSPNNKLTLKVYNGSVSSPYDSSYRFTSGQQMIFELHYRYSTTAAPDNVEVKIDDIPVFQHGGPTAFTTGSPEGLGTFEFGSDIYSGYWDDIAINDTTGATDNSWCGDGHVVALAPNAQGDSSEFSRSDSTKQSYELVGDISTTTYVYSDVSAAQDLYNIPPLVLAPNDQIARVRLRCLALKLTSESPDIQLALKRSASSPIELLNVPPLGTSSLTRTVVIPPSGATWQPEDFNDMQIGVKNL